MPIELLYMPQLRNSEIAIFAHYGDLKKIRRKIRKIYFRFPDNRGLDQNGPIAFAMPRIIFGGIIFISL